MTRNYRSRITPLERTPPITLLKLGTLQFVMIVVNGLLISVVVGVSVWPSLHARYIEHIGIRKYEADYGFRTGDVMVHRAGQPSETAWGIVWVDPTGVFSGLGVRAGDVPFEYHGGIFDMYYALEQASRGESSSFEVHNSADAHLGRTGLRVVNLPAR